MLFFILCYCVNIVLKLNFPFILMILCTEENNQSFSGALKWLNPFVTSKTLFFYLKNLRFYSGFFWPEWNWKKFTFLWHENLRFLHPFFAWLKLKKFTFLWHEKSPFFTPFFGLNEIEKIYFFMSYMKNLRFLHRFFGLNEIEKLTYDMKNLCF